MKINNLLDTIKTKTNVLAVKVKKSSPEILVVAGVVGVVASTVMACRATLKMNAILEESKETLDKIKEYSEKEEIEYTLEDAKKDKVIVYAQTGVKIAKMYAPAVVLGTLSIAGIVASHRILSKRNAALVAAYTTIDQSFKKYRKEVIERFGEKVDRELKNGIKVKKVEETVIEPETGKERKQKTTIEVANPSDYSIWFDESCAGWDSNNDYNIMFLSAQQSYANDKLKVEGFMFLNDIYEMIGAKKTQTGQVVGWIYDKNNSIGDNFIDFKVTEAYKELPDGTYKKGLLLDFNVDGYILNHI